MVRESPTVLRKRLANARSVAVLTGAGVSAESGVPTFRGADGLWRRHRAEELATPGQILPALLGFPAGPQERACSA